MDRTAYAARGMKNRIAVESWPVGVRLRAVDGWSVIITVIAGVSWRSMA